MSVNLIYKCLMSRNLTKLQKINILQRNDKCLTISLLLLLLLLSSSSSSSLLLKSLLKTLRKALSLYQKLNGQHKERTQGIQEYSQIYVSKIIEQINTVLLKIKVLWDIRPSRLVNSYPLSKFRTVWK
jgi:hypothetical protein